MRNRADLWRPTEAKALRLATVRNHDSLQVIPLLAKASAPESLHEVGVGVGLTQVPAHEVPWHLGDGFAFVLLAYGHDLGNTCQLGGAPGITPRADRRRQRSDRPGEHFETERDIDRGAMGFTEQSRARSAGNR